MDIADYHECYVKYVIDGTRPCNFPSIHYLFSDFLLSQQLTVATPIGLLLSVV